MRVRFGPFVLDSETRELLRADVPVPLSPKAFELLCVLVAHRPKAMAKSDLQERLWPTTFVVEKNLANLIGEIRDAIGDDPSNPRFIRTVHRFGYAFRETTSRTETGTGASRRWRSLVPPEMGRTAASGSTRARIFSAATPTWRFSWTRRAFRGVMRCSRSRRVQRRLKTSEARTERLLGISGWTGPDRLAMGTSSPSAP